MSLALLVGGVLLGVLAREVLLLRKEVRAARVEASAHRAEMASRLTPTTEVLDTHNRLLGSYGDRLKELEHWRTRVANRNGGRD